MLYRLLIICAVILVKVYTYNLCMVDTEVICIGGGVSAAGEFLLSRIEKYYKEYVFHASRNTKILKATLGNDAGMYGAARLVLNE